MVYWDSCSSHALGGYDLRNIGSAVDRSQFPTECEGYIPGRLDTVEDVRTVDATFPGGHTLPLNVLIVKGRPPDTIIVGTDTYWSHGVEINFQRAFIKWTDEHGQHRIPMSGDRRELPSVNIVNVRRRHAIKGLHQQFYTSPVDAPNDSTILFTPDLASPMWEQGFATPASVSTVRDGCIRVPITNLGKKSKRIKASWKLGNWT